MPAAPPAPAAPVVVPDLAAHPLVVAARGVVGSLMLELTRIEAAQTDLLARDAQLREDAARIAERVVAGEPLASLRTPPHDRQYAALSIDRRNVLAGLELARQKLAEAERVAARDLAEAFAPQFRTLVRAAALAWVQWIRAARQLEGVSRELGPLYGYAGLDDPLPRSRTDDPADPSGGVAQLLRRLVDAKVIDPATDAEVLAGFAIALPDRPPVVPAAPPPKKQISFKQAMRSLGASLGYTRSGDDEA